MREFKVGLVGLGNIAKVHTLANLGIPLSFSDLPFSVRMGKVLRIDTRIPCPYYFEGYASGISEMTGDASTDLIDICSPNGIHCRQAFDVIAAKKSLYLEKPIATTAGQAYELARKASEAGILHQTAFMYRFMPGVAAMRDLVAAGEIGEVVDFKFVTLHSGYLNEKRKRDWKLSKDASGGGPLLDIGIHMTDAAAFILGRVRSVSCRAQYVIRMRPDAVSGEPVEVDVEDRAQAGLRLVNGRSGTIEVSRVASQLDQSSTLSVYGTGGSLHFDAYAPARLTVYRQARGSEETGKAAVLSDYAKHLDGCFPRDGRGWLVDAHTASQMNLYRNLAAGRVLFAETPDFRAAADAHAVVEACYRSAGGCGEKVDVVYQ